MDVILDDAGTIVARVQSCPFRIWPEGSSLMNRAFKSVPELLADAFDRSVAAGPHVFVMAAWGYVTGRFIDPVGMLRVMSEREVAFSFFSAGRDDYDALQRARDVLRAPVWEAVALDTVNTQLRDDPAAVRARNMVIVPYNGDREDAVSRLVSVLAR